MLNPVTPHEGRLIVSASYLDVSNISMSYRRGAHAVRALEDVTFLVGPGESVGVVGESGSGKSTLVRVALGLERPTGGGVSLFGESLHDMSSTGRRAIRRRLGVVFQEPREQLDPRWTVRRILSEPSRVHRTKAPTADSLCAHLGRVALSPDVLDRHPDTLSGGQAQRVAIARALALEPHFVLLDEPTASLDMTTRTQVLALFKTLKADLGLTLLYISHDLDSVRGITDKVVVLYQGKIMESGPTEHVLRRPGHPYTRALLAAELSIDGARDTDSRHIARITPDSDTVPTTGCPFAPRCPLVMEACRSGTIPLVEAGESMTACLRSG